MTDRSGTVLGISGTVMDVTERYLAVTKVEHARRRLSLLNEFGSRVGDLLDAARIAQELANAVVPRLADFAAVILLQAVAHGDDLPRHPHDHNVVEGAEDVIPDGDVQGGPAFHREATFAYGGKGGMEIGHIHLGQESEFAEIDAKYGDGVFAGQLHGPKDGAVATQRHQKIGSLRHFGFGYRHGSAVQPGDLLVQAHDGDLVPLGPGQDTVHRGGDIAKRVQDHTQGADG